MIGLPKELLVHEFKFHMKLYFRDKSEFELECYARAFADVVAKNNQEIERKLKIPN